MKQNYSVKLSGPLVVEALRILRAVPGLVVTAEPTARDCGTDAVLEFAGSETQVAVQVKSRANAATAWQLGREADARPDIPMLLIAGETTAEAREILQQHGIGVIDGLGHAHIELPGLLFHLESHRSRRQAWPTRLNGKAGVAAQALLVHPERRWQVQELAEEAGISLGLAHRVLARLTEEGVVTAEGSGRNRVRQVTSPAALLDLWAEENTYRPERTLAYLLAQNPQGLIAGLGHNLDRGGIGYALTGVAAASLVAPFITAVPVAEVWVTATATPEELCEAAGAEPVADGQNVVFLQARDDTPLAFREQADGLWVASRFRLYADLRQAPRRGREQADHLRQEVIGF
jgi:IclR helix-turn-helix domain